MISKGNEVKPFQQYGSMPSLEYESEVEGVTGDVNSKISDSIENNQNQLHIFSLGDKVLYGDENARDVFNITIDQDFYEKTGYRKITNSDLVKKWKKYIATGNENWIKSDIPNVSDFTRFIMEKSDAKYDTNIHVGFSNYLKPITYNERNTNYNNTIYCNGNIGIDTNVALTVKNFNAKLQELSLAGNPLYVIYQLAEPETETITDQTLISEIENFINNSYTYKQVTSINSDFYLKLNYRKNMYYDLESRVKALEQANTPSSTPSNTPE